MRTLNRDAIAGESTKSQKKGQQPLPAEARIGSAKRVIINANPRADCRRCREREREWLELLLLPVPERREGDDVVSGFPPRSELGGPLFRVTGRESGPGFRAWVKPADGRLYSWTGVTLSEHPNTPFSGSSPERSEGDDAVFGVSRSELAGPPFRFTGREIGSGFRSWMKPAGGHFYSWTGVTLSEHPNTPPEGF